MQPELQNVPCKQLMHMSSPIMSDKMEFVFCGTDYIDFVTYNYLTGFLETRACLILWQLLLADETWWNEEIYVICGATPSSIWRKSHCNHTHTLFSGKTQEVSHGTPGRWTRDLEINRYKINENRV